MSRNIRKELNDHHLKAKKRFGQNFLKDQNILNKIVLTSNINKDTAVIEIGPGMGALTEHLCEAAGFVLAYEIDTNLIPILEDNLKNYHNFKVINQDILKADVASDIQTYLQGYSHIDVVANLPYYITTPIIMGLLSLNVPIEKYVVMMQLEVAQRICGRPATKDYNALSVMVAYKAKASLAFKVPRTAFVPAPKVDSAVVVLDAYETLPYSVLDEDTLLSVLRIAFQQRRKTLYNNFIQKYSPQYVTKMLDELGFAASMRAEALTLQDFIALSNYITQNQDK